MNLTSLLSNPSISLIIIGAVLFIIGFCGCFGALLEVYVLLVLVGNFCHFISLPSLDHTPSSSSLQYSILLGMIVLAEISLVLYVYFEQDQVKSMEATAYSVLVYLSLTLDTDMTLYVPPLCAPCRHMQRLS